MKKERRKKKKKNKLYVEVSKSSSWKLKNFKSPFCGTTRTFKNIHRYTRNIIYIGLSLILGVNDASSLGCWNEPRSGC